MRTTRAHTAAPAVRLLLAVGDSTLGPVLSKALEHHGFRADWVHWGGDLLRALRDRQYACILLGSDLADLPGAAALRAIRDADTAQAVIVMTHPIDTADRILLLDAGADDHLTLPIDAAEVAARVRAVTRRAHPARAVPATLVHGPLSLCADRRSATWHGREVVLTNMEFWLLETLLRRRHQALSRATLEELMYGWGEQTGSNTVEVHVHHLRRKLDRRLIRTLRGMGYQITPAEELLCG